MGIRAFYISWSIENDMQLIYFLVLRNHLAISSLHRLALENETRLKFGRGRRTIYSSLIVVKVRDGRSVPLISKLGWIIRFSVLEKCESNTAPY